MGPPNGKNTARRGEERHSSYKNFLVSDETIGHRSDFKTKRCQRPLVDRNGKEWRSIVPDIYRLQKRCG
jgi:hypothetical protein